MNSLGIKSDIFGEMREQGTSIDIGPFEIQ